MKTGRKIPVSIGNNSLEKFREGKKSENPPGLSFESTTIPIFRETCLSLVFLKYLCDAFGKGKKKPESVKMKSPRRSFLKGEKAQGDSKISPRNKPVIPPKARWNYLLKQVLKHDFPKILLKAFSEIEAANEDLKNLFPRAFPDEPNFKEFLRQFFSTVETIYLDPRNLPRPENSIPHCPSGLFEGDLFGGILKCFLAELSKRRSSEQKLRDSEEKYRALVEASKDATFLETIDGRILECNTSACKVYGYTKEEFTKMSVAQLVPQEVASTLPQVSSQIAQGGEFFLETLGKRKTGEIFPTEVSARVTTIGGEQKVVVFVRDISERKRAQEERQKLETRIQQTHKLESLGVLAGGIAHDFNNILTGILGFADLALLEMSPFSPAREKIQRIVQASRRAAELTQQLLAYSGKGRLANQVFDLKELIEEMSHLLKVSVSKKAVLKFVFSPNIPPLEGDPTQIRQVIMNLVINSSEAIGEKSGMIEISTGAMNCTREYLSEALNGSELEAGFFLFLEVTDTGCGLDPDIQSKIFDPFFTTKFKGRGLGLATVLGIVRVHKGAIRVSSSEGKGSSFRIIFPPSKKFSGMKKMESQRISPDFAETGTILLVDDEETVRALGIAMLENLGFKVLAASKGSEGIDLLKANLKDIKAVILDLTMPEINGLETFREMREITRNLKIIICSGYNEQELTVKSKNFDFAAFLQKPFSSDELIKVLGIALRK